MVGSRLCKAQSDDIGCRTALTKNQARVVELMVVGSSERDAAPSVAQERH